MHSLHSMLALLVLSSLCTPRLPCPYSLPQGIRGLQQVVKGIKEPFPESWTVEQARRALERGVTGWKEQTAVSFGNGLEKCQGLTQISLILHVPVAVLIPQPHNLMKKALTCHVPLSSPSSHAFCNPPIRKISASYVEITPSFSPPGPLGVQPHPSLPL